MLKTGPALDYDLPRLAPATRKYCIFRSRSSFQLAAKQLRHLCLATTDTAHFTSTEMACIDQAEFY